MAIAPAAPCRNHPGREAIGVCVRCRTRVCSECSTKIDGINHCVTCLAEAAGNAAPPPGSSPVASRPAASVLSAAAYLLLLGVLAWAMLAVLLPGRG